MIKFCLHINTKVLYKFIVSLWIYITKHAQSTRKQQVCYLCNSGRKKWVMKLILCIQIIVKVCYKLILWFWWGWSGITEVSKIASLHCLYDVSKKEVRDEANFLHADKHQSFYKLALSFFMEVVRDVQSTLN